LWGVLDAHVLRTLDSKGARLKESHFLIWLSLALKSVVGQQRNDGTSTPVSEIGASLQTLNANVDIISG